jgi:hypothetical protein
VKSFFSSRVSKFNALMTLCVLGVNTFSFPAVAAPQEVCVRTSAGDIACGTPVPRRTQTNSKMSPTEWGIDRSGLDYSNFDLTDSDPTLCLNACAIDSSCKAWTYVKPNTIQGPNPRCWLKYAIPSPRQSPCCVSGTKTRE